MCEVEQSILACIVTRVNGYIQNQVIPDEEESLLKKEKEKGTEENNVHIKDDDREYKDIIHKVSIQVHIKVNILLFDVLFGFIHSLLGRKLLVCLPH